MGFNSAFKGLNLIAKERIVTSAIDPFSKSVADPQDRVILTSICAVEYRTRIYSLLKHSVVHYTVHAAGGGWATGLIHVQFRPGIGDLAGTESFRSFTHFLQVN